MYYAVGTTIDLKTGRVYAPDEERPQPKDEHKLVPVGTRFIRRLINGEPKWVMQIPVMAV